MKIIAIIFFVTVSIIGSSCYAFRVNKTPNKHDNVVKGEYLVLLKNADFKPEKAIKDIGSEFKKAKIKILRNDVIHMIFKKKNDPGLEKINKKLLKYEWFRLVEPNRIATISG